MTPRNKKDWWIICICALAITSAIALPTNALLDLIFMLVVLGPMFTAASRLIRRRTGVLVDANELSQTERDHLIGYFLATVFLTIMIIIALIARFT